eukprot:CAMPEP_0181418128 /NCGR_PEP_ID=MMETSP1110-20121109/11394_1 /TAXON_ID=174948 /ORGANISM="Symbiodinium sp., Strain CCMP421" /LENGTH=202 /DNA_ID=CAMNT_0023541095 /DNA_START=271 /DNA_END=875 /DNA_ORIENTATION=+
MALQRAAVHTDRPEIDFRGARHAAGHRRDTVRVPILGCKANGASLVQEGLGREADTSRIGDDGTVLGGHNVLVGPQVGEAETKEAVVRIAKQPQGRAGEDATGPAHAQGHRKSAARVDPSESPTGAQRQHRQDMHCLGVSEEPKMIEAHRQEEGDAAGEHKGLHVSEPENPKPLRRSGPLCSARVWEDPILLARCLEAAILV